MFSRLFPSPGTAQPQGRSQHCWSNLGSCTRYPSLLSGQRQCGFKACHCIHLYWHKPISCNFKCTYWNCKGLSFRLHFNYLYIFYICVRTTYATLQIWISLIRKYLLINIEHYCSVYYYWVTNTFLCLCTFLPVTNWHIWKTDMYKIQYIPLIQFSCFKCFVSLSIEHGPTFSWCVCYIICLRTNKNNALTNGLFTLAH